VWVAKGASGAPFDLDGRLVPKITAYLFHDGGHETPSTLDANAGKTFQGVILLGQGFSFDNHDKSGVANSIAEMEQLITRDQRNAERIFPFLGGEELTDSPTHQHRRCVINFADFPLRREKLDGILWQHAPEEQRKAWLRVGIVPNDYPEPVALDWPDLLAIVEHKVKPERLEQNDEGGRTKWWQFLRPRVELLAAISGKSRVLCNALYGTHLAFLFLPSRLIFSNKINVTTFETDHALALLQSRIHEVWARFFSATLKDDLAYTPSDCFETFPFPANWETDTALKSAGKKYYEFRAGLMVRHNEGLTKTYNRFHDPVEANIDILRLRELHAQMDRAVLAAYGWTDLPTDCEFIADYVEEDANGEPVEKSIRYRWPDAVRDEVLARLLKLNAERAEQERLAGESAAPSKPAKKAASGVKRGRKPKATSAVKPTLARQLPTEFRLAETSPGYYAVGLIVALLSEARGRLLASQLIDSFTLATQPEQMKRLAPPEYETAVNEWAAIWNEQATPHDLLPALDNLTSANIAVERTTLGIEFSLQDGPKAKLPPHLAYDAWLALRIAETLEPSAALVTGVDRDAFIAKLELLTA